MNGSVMERGSAAGTEAAAKRMKAAEMIRQEGAEFQRVPQKETKETKAGELLQKEAKVAKGGKLLQKGLV